MNIQSSQQDQPTLSVDRDAAISQLTALGYQPGETVYLRFFFPSSDPRKTGGGGRKLEAKFPALPWGQIEAYQAEGRGCYFVVNGGGDKNIHVKACRTLFFEHDDRPKDEQVTLWRELGLPEPSTQYDTGGKSIHNYYILSEPCDPERWREVEKALLNFVDGDRSIGNPSRVMRLAGCWHVGPGREPQRTTLIHESGKRYSIEEIAAVVCKPAESKPAVGRPERAVSTGLAGSYPTSWTKFDRGFSLPCPEVVPIEICLAAENRQRLASGVSEPGRNAGGYALAADLMGTANHLQAIGQRFDGDPRTLFDQYCNRCSPPLDQTEADTVWRNVEGDSPGPSLSPDKIEGCIKAWVWNQVRETRPLKPVKASGESKTESMTYDTSITGASYQSKPDREGSSDESMTYDGVVSPQDFLAFREAIGSGSDFNPFELFGTQLQSKAEHDSQILCVRPLAVWQYLMPAVASLMGRSTYLDLGGGWKVPNIVWSMLIQMSGTGKSRVRRLICEPLSRKDRTVYDSWRESYNIWKQQKKARRDEHDEQDLQPPLLRKYIFEVATPQAIVKGLAEQEENGVLWSRDELKGLFYSLDQFSGQGEGLEILLESWDGTPCAVDRVDRDNTYRVPESRLSVVGGIQPGMVGRVFDLEDAQGVLARFLIAQPPELKYERLSGRLELESELEVLYRFVEQTDWGCIQATQDADDLFTVIANDFTNRPTQINAIRTWQNKLAGHTARIALVVHAIDCFYDRSKPTNQLTKDTLYKAQWLAENYRKHFLHLMGATASDGLSGVIAQIQQKATERGNDGIAISNLYMGIRKLQELARLNNTPVSAYTRQICEELVEQGFGTIKKVGKSYIYVATPDTPS